MSSEREKELMKKVLDSKLGTNTSIIPSHSALVRMLVVPIVFILSLAMFAEITYIPTSLGVILSLLSVMIGVFWGMKKDEDTNKNQQG